MSAPTLTERDLWLMKAAWDHARGRTDMPTFRDWLRENHPNDQHQIPWAERLAVDAPTIPDTTDRAERLSASSPGENSDDSHHGGRARGVAGGSEDHRQDERGGADERDLGDGGAGREVRLLHPLEPGAAHHGAADADGGSASGDDAGGRRGDAGSATGLTDRTLAPVTDAAPAATPVAPMPYVSDALALIAAERARQISVEGWTSTHDDRHKHAELARAAAVYAAPVGWRVGMVPTRNGERALWPWDSHWYKPAPVGQGQCVRDLVKAGALIVAEIERLQRKLADGGAHG